MEKLIAVGFTPPYVIGLDGEFNTFRLGTLLARNLSVGDKVYLMDEKSRLVFGMAEITGIDQESLGEACLLHGKKNHTQKDEPDDGKFAERLFKIIQKIYGPHIATPEKKCVVVHMRRLE